ncbi:MAG: HAD-IA family hydrolase [Geobacter sp.]|nr:HAD-IA family hydrolase [Geobacter sp.]
MFSNGVKAEAVIFDFDGVIVDTEPLHYKSFQRVLAPLGLDFTWQEYVDTYIGFDDRDAFREAFRSNNKPLDQEELHSLIIKKAAVFQEVIRDGVTAYPGVIELIQRLRAANIPLAICSGALRSDIDPILELLCLTDYFYTVVSADDVATSKPDPECYQLAFDNLLSFSKCSFSKELTIAIEDTPTGIKAAKQAGLNVCAVSNSYSAIFLTDASFTINSLECLIDIKSA